MRIEANVLLVAYFLSRCGFISEGKATPGPPTALGVTTWDRAYAMFYRALAHGRTLTTFRNSLRNARDDFDAHVKSGRVGWRLRSSLDDKRPPRPLSKPKQDILAQWGDKSDDELWLAVQPFADFEVRIIDDAILMDLAAELDAERAIIISKTEGGRKVVISVRVERDPTLRAAALRIHGTTCSVCGFSFGEMYGKWGDGFAVVHHLAPFGFAAADTCERTTNPETDLAVVCANCHCMIHRRRNQVLTIEELRTKLYLNYRSKPIAAE